MLVELIIQLGPNNGYPSYSLTNTSKLSELLLSPIYLIIIA